MDRRHEPAAPRPARTPFRIMAGVLGALAVVTAVLEAVFSRLDWSTGVLLLVTGIGFVGIAISGYWLGFRPRRLD